MGKRNIHILIEKFFENDLSPEIQKKFHAWLLDRNFQEEKEKAMVTLWEEKSAVANESTFQELSRLHKRIEASDRMLQKPIGLYIKRIAAILLLPLLGAFGTYYYLTKVNPVVEEAQLKECFVANGEQKQVKLPDGTKVWLNSGSTLEYAADFMENREVALNGEALFDVTKDNRHPFVVLASEVKVKVHGTCFNVNSYPKEENIRVTLFRGSVSLEAGGKEAYLYPGEIAALNKRDKTLNITSADMFYESFWASESVRFEAKSLRYITRYLEKWYNVKIEVDPTIPDSQAYTFTIKDESLEVILRIMSRINPIAYTFDEDDHVQIMHVEPSKK